MSQLPRWITPVLNNFFSLHLHPVFWVSLRCSAFVIRTVANLLFSQFNITVQAPSTRPMNLSNSGICMSWWLVTWEHWKHNPIHLDQWMGPSLSWVGGRALALSFGESLHVLLPRNLSCCVFSFITLKSAFKYPGSLLIYFNWSTIDSEYCVSFETEQDPMFLDPMSSTFFLFVENLAKNKFN